MKKHMGQHGMGLRHEGHHGEGNAHEHGGPSFHNHLAHVDMHGSHAASYHQPEHMKHGFHHGHHGMGGHTKHHGCHGMGDMGSMPAPSMDAGGDSDEMS